MVTFEEVRANPCKYVLLLLTYRDSVTTHHRAALRYRGYSGLADDREECTLGSDGPLAGEDADAWLTSRQVQVLRLAAAGLVAKEIARRLGISIRTVEG